MIWRGDGKTGTGRIAKFHRKRFSISTLCEKEQH
jgi:hypothetical protein